MSAIADLILEIGRARAQGAAQQGHIWGSALANIGQIPGQVMQQRRQDQRDAMAQQELNARLRLQGQEGELNQQQVELNRQRLAAGQQTIAQQSAVDAVYAATIGDDGLPDMAKVQQVLAASGQTHLLPIIREQRNKWAASDEALTASKTTAREAAMKLEAEQRDALGADGAALAAAQYDPGLFGIRVSMLAKQGRVPTEQADTWIHQAEQDPASVRSIVDQWMAGSKTQQTLAHTKAEAKKLEMEMAGTMPTPPAAAETARHNAEMERIDALKVGREEAAQKETARHNRAVEMTAATKDKLTKVEHKDPVSGRTVIEWLPESQIRGQTFEKGVGSTLESRLSSAQAVNQTGEDMIQKLSDQAYAAKVGPAMGRFNSLRDFIGNPPPEFAELAGQIESYSLANMGVHGMRSAQGAEQIKKLLDQKHTPESLVATIRGLNAFSTHFMENEGRPGPPSAPQTPAPEEWVRDASGKLVKKGR